MEYIDLFNLKVVRNEKESDFFISQNAVSNILRNRYRVFETQIPNYNGTTNTYILRQKTLNSYPVALYTNGIKVETNTRPKYVTYLIYNENNEVKGNLCVNEENTIGFYYINDDKVMITSRTVGVPTEECLVSRIDESENLDENVIPCGNDNNTVESFEETDIVVNRVTSVNNTYCVKILWEISYTLYDKLILAQNYTIEEFIETLNTVLNQAYNTDNNESTFQFEIGGIVSYTTANSDPNVGASTYGVRTYAYNNYSSVYDYDIVYRLEGNPGPAAGVGTCGGVYTALGGGAIGWLWNAPVNLDTNTLNDFYNRLETTVHEVGHNFGLAHTHDNSCGSFQTTQACNYCVGQQPPPCDSVMSYCYWRQLSFHPIRMNDLNNFVATYGGDLLCDVTPNEPYLLLSITNTNMTSNEFSYTVELKDCFDNQWYTYGTDFIYNDFSLIIILSELPFSSNCYEYRITEQTTNQICTGNVFTTQSIDEVEPTPTQSEIIIEPTPTQSEIIIEPTPTQTPIRGINTIFTYYPNK